MDDSFFRHSSLSSDTRVHEGGWLSGDGVGGLVGFGALSQVQFTEQEPEEEVTYAATDSVHFLCVWPLEGYLSPLRHDVDVYFPQRAKLHPDLSHFGRLWSLLRAFVSSTAKYTSWTQTTRAVRDER